MGVGSSRQQYGSTVLRTQGRGHEAIEPRALALRFMAHDGHLGATDHDDVLSDAMYGVARAIATWEPRDDGVSLTTWCWWTMRSTVSHGRRHRARFTREDPTDWDFAPGEWHPNNIEHGYKQVEDRLLLQRWADHAHLTDAQADSLAWLAVYGFEHGPSPDGQRPPNPTRGTNGGAAKAAFGRLRRVAVTGRPFVRWGSTLDTAGQPKPDDSPAAVRAAVDA